MDVLAPDPALDFVVTNHGSGSVIMSTKGAI